MTAFEILGYNIYVKSNDAILRSDFMATATSNPVMEKENTDVTKLGLYYKDANIIHFTKNDGRYGFLLDVTD